VFTGDGTLHVCNPVILAGVWGVSIYELSADDDSNAPGSVGFYPSSWGGL
jgi:hypothetical protein